ncbi:hypothetical protein LINPERHAP2_LOCUS13712, partial [Linum perenne]
MVMTWLVSSMTEEISANYLGYSTAQELRDDVTMTYSDLGNQSQFLSGLNVELDDVRGRIVGRNPLPSIGEVFAEVRREETRRGVMLGKKPDIGAETSALQVTGERFGARQKGADPKAHLRCDYCGKPRHTRETCWKLNGKPPHLKNPRANAANFGEGGLLSKEQLEQIMALLQP